MIIDRNINALAILGIVKSVCRQTETDFTPIKTEMMSGDFEHLIATVEKHFGHIVEFVDDDDDGE